ncbi:MAG: DUF5667 domain-containing protein, partial [Candidatus Peribacteraceae bacterium]|nr:DUF5667 domain-containing protein [Candidatus Peribacteraceae bacterium]
AEMQVTLAPTQGEVYVLMENLWQPLTEELKLEAGMRIKTLDGQASIILGDDGVVRLDANTIVQLLDASDRLEPASELVPTLKLFLGRLWVQGLVPSHLRGITVSTSDDSVTVNEGSVSISSDEETVTVEVFDRRARVARGDEEAVLVSGERMQLRENSVLMTKKIPEARFGEEWVEDNLGRDAVHRQEIAQLQQEKLAARAGILPTSTLYPVKRAAEAMDVFLTFGEEARIQKKLQYADQRLTEAAALIKEGETDAVSVSLEEYRTTLIALATGSGDGTLAQFLLQQAVVETTAEISAALPGDAGYALKKVVLETSTTLSNDVVPEGDVQGGLLLDTLAALTQAVEEGKVSGLQQTWEELQPQLALLSESGSTLSPAVRKETMAALGELATTLAEQSVEGKTADLDPTLLTAVSAYLPSEESGPPTLSESDVMGIVAGIKERIFVYHLQQPRINQFLRELAALQGLPDQGRILRRLYFVLPEGPENFPERVQQEMIRLQWQKAAER